jgi:D-3-phosphoglycerate dehydrogenase / 2-oxoglutarate reductase
MKIYVLEECAQAGMDVLKERADEVVLWDHPEVDRWWEDADGVIVRLAPISAEGLAQAKNLRVVAKHGVGVENIDLDAAKAHGVTVVNTPGVNSEAVAELAMALALGVARRLAELDRLTRAGAIYDRNAYEGVGFWQKSVGVVGMGNIGTRVARKWYGAFDANIVAYDPYVPADRWSELPHERVSSLEELLRRSDLVSVHVPRNEETIDLIDTEELAIMRSSAILVNTSRGGIINEAALYTALKERRIFGAGLDVFDVEPPTLDNPLVSLPNILTTPHAAGGTNENHARTSLAVVDELLTALSDEGPRSRVV